MSEKQSIEWWSAGVEGWGKTGYFGQMARAYSHTMNKLWESMVQHGESS